MGCGNNIQPTGKRQLGLCSRQGLGHTGQGVLLTLGLGTCNSSSPCMMSCPTMGKEMGQEPMDPLGDYVPQGCPGPPVSLRHQADTWCDESKIPKNPYTSSQLPTPMCQQTPITVPRTRHRTQRAFPTNWNQGRPGVGKLLSQPRGSCSFTAGEGRCQGTSQASPLLEDAGIPLRQKEQALPTWF